MPHGCCVPLCRGKGYRTVNIDGKNVKVTIHKFPEVSERRGKKQKQENVELKRKWLHAIQRDVGMFSNTLVS